ncbi:hypothetical protein TWF730_002777 [Orbilia blumenaviensis]|uniref:Uncharacterized protein n=1 Tax=Orbilia blumenaviensis TaxID=1796055 RepID=A0AAV9UBL0_9PEZI
MQDRGQNQPGEPNKPRILNDCTVDESEIRKNHSSAGIRESYLHAVLKSSSTMIGWIRPPASKKQHGRGAREHDELLFPSYAFPLCTAPIFLIYFFASAFLDVIA